MDIHVHPATPARWDELVELFERRGPRGGTPFTAGCWCQYWHLRGRAYERGWGAPNRARLEEQVRGGSPPGLLASIDGVAVGWCRVGPRESFERLESSPRLARVDDKDVWSVVCFAVDPNRRRNGVAAALLGAAAAYAATQGARILEAYPVREGHPMIDAFTGHAPLFRAAGFDVVKQAGRRSIVRRRLSDG